MLNFGVGGHYHLKVLENGEVVKELSFSNLIPATALDGMGVSTNSPLAEGQYCRVGTGTTPPAMSDTSLQNPIGSWSALQRSITGESIIVGPPRYVRGQKTYTFPVGGIVGTISEIGIFNSNQTLLHSRALIKDGLGNPTTITLTAEQQLVATWEYRIYIPTGDVTGTFPITINGVTTNHNYTLRVANNASTYIWPISNSFIDWGGSTVSAYETQTLGSEGSTISGTALPSSTVSQATYINGSFSRDITGVFTISQGNFGTGIGSLSFNKTDTTSSAGYERFQMSLSPKIAKNSSNTFSFTFRVSWSNYTP